jgi:biopolymer transport protein TolQ
MVHFFGGNIIWGLILQGDLMTKLVLFVLLILSILCWSIALYKLILCAIKRRQLEQVVQDLKNVDSFKTLFVVMSDHAKTLPGYFLSRSLHHVKELLLLKKNGKQAYAQTSGIDFLQMQVSQVVDEIMAEQEEYVPVLSVSAAISPLLGLFGTVWGLVHAFISISQKQSADIVTVAPGIAEALITTVAGLLVAIPAVALFYYVSYSIKSIEQSLYLISDKVIVVARNLVVDIDAVTSEESFDGEIL